MPLVPDMVGIIVHDMKTALDFYRLLDLAIPDGQDEEPFVEVTTPNGYRISWNAESMIRKMEPDWVIPVGQRISLAFNCGSPDEVDTAYNKIVAAGHAGHKPPFDAFWGQRYAQVLDPDGNVVDLFAWVPAAEADN